MATTVLNKESALTVNEVINFFNNYPPSERCIDASPVEVKGGEVYIFKTDDTNKQGKALL